jgi:MFS family permease
VIGLIGSSYFMGWCLTCLIVPPLADKYGRKWITRIGVLMQVIPQIIIAFSTSVTLTISMVFVAGMGCSGRQIVGYVYG